MKDVSTKALRELYQSNLARFVECVRTFPNDDLEGPLLIQPSAYFEQQKKLLVIGQETRGWSCEYNNIDAQLDAYIRFNMGETYRSTPFWNLTRKVESLLGIARCSCAWSNLSRFDHGGRTLSGPFLDEVRKLDFLVREEIKILRPDICLFYTNWKNDYRLTALYPNIEFRNLEGLPDGHFVQLVHTTLPKLTFRTPHPRTIRTRKWEDAFLTYMRELSDNGESTSN